LARPQRPTRSVTEVCNLRMVHNRRACAGRRSRPGHRSSGSGTNPGRKPGEGEPSWASDRSADGLGGPPRFRTSGSVAQEAADRDVETVGLRGRVEPARVELSAQPGELALGQLAGGGDGLVAEARRVAAA